MTTQEIRHIVYEAIQLLRHAQPGAGSTVNRAAARAKANALLNSLPPKWWRKLPAAESEAIAAALGQ